MRIKEILRVSNISSHHFCPIKTIVFFLEFQKTYVNERLDLLHSGINTKAESQLCLNLYEEENDTIFIV